MRGELLEAAEASPPVLARLVLADALQKLDGLHPDFGVLVEQAKGDIKEPGMVFGGDAEKKTDLVVRMDVLRQCQIDVATLRR